MLVPSFFLGQTIVCRSEVVLKKLAQDRPAFMQPAVDGESGLACLRRLLPFCSEKEEIDHAWGGEGNLPHDKKRKIKFKFGIYFYLGETLHFGLDLTRINVDGRREKIGVAAHLSFHLILGVTRSCRFIAIALRHTAGRASTWVEKLTPTRTFFGRALRLFLRQLSISRFPSQPGESGSVDCTKHKREKEGNSFFSSFLSKHEIWAFFPLQESNPILLFPLIMRGMASRV